PDSTCHSLSYRSLCLSVHPLLLYLIFFCRCGVPLVLLSFPTRRSSDLWRSLRYPPALVVSSSFGSALFGVFAAGAALVGGAAGADRKSTRLNSSHVSISYAVFCLKKKTSTDSCCYPPIIVHSHSDSHAE